MKKSKIEIRDSDSAELDARHEFVTCHSSIVFTLQIERTDKADAAAAQLYNLARESCKVFFAVSITTATAAVLKECVQKHRYTLSRHIWRVIELTASPRMALTTIRLFRRA